jgi:RHS repeat-associated protein
MPAAAKEEMLASPNAEGIFSLAAGVAAALDTRDGANADRGEKSHQGIFSKNRRPRIGSTWLKWSGTHQDRSLAWSETMLGPTIYLYDGPNDIEEVDGTGNGLARYTDGQRIDEPLAELRSGNTNFYEQDGLGSVVSLSNGTGTLSGTYIYDSFGNLTASTGTVTNPFRYTGREFDQETGIYYYRARYYGQNIGRLNSEDPLRFTAGVNFYAYTWNNPANYSDPFGLCPPRVANHITCDTVLPNGQTVGDWVRQLSNGINQAAQDASTSTPDGPSPVLTPDLIAQQVYSSTNFRNMFGGPGANYPFLGDVGNFAYGAVSANIGVPLWGAEMVGGGYSLFKHPSADWGWPWGMDPSAQVQVPAGYKAKCTK